MSRCPYCDFENIEGADDCEQCQLPLCDSYLREPKNEVERGLLRDHVGDLWPKWPLLVRSDVRVRDALRLMVDNRIGCLLLVEGGKLIGIFSERDALTRVGADAVKVGDRPVREFMTHSPQCLEPTAKIAFAVQRMDLGSYRHVPIVNEQGQPIGVISVRDILRYLTEKMTS